MKYFTYKFAGLIIGTFFFISGNVFAENGHAYNGSFCTASLGSQAANFDFLFGIRNVSGSRRIVSCPVVVDEIANTSGTNRVWVYFSGGGTVRCSLYSMNGNGTIRQARSGSRTNSGWLSIPNITTDDFWGSYAMYCDIPNNGSIETVWVGENN